MDPSLPDRWSHLLRLSPPSLGDNVGDADRLRQAVGKVLSVEEVSIPLAIQRLAPALLRQEGYAVRCACFAQNERRGHVVGLAPPSRPHGLAGIAVDLGTTRVVLRLVLLETKKVIGEVSIDNPQATVAPDVLARIHWADRHDGLAQLQKLIQDGLNEAVADVCRQASFPIAQICLFAIAGNTTMTHLLLGLDPRGIIREPYIPGANRFELLRANRVGLSAGPGAGVYIFPNIGSYFGGDVVAGILFAGLHKNEEPSLLVDVGTNAEVVIGNQEWLLACAGAAGPALEGGAASMGTTAGPGVIDKVDIDNRVGELFFTVRTIGGSPARGICGSGLIDLAAGLFRSGAVDVKGELVAKVCGERLTYHDGVGTLVIVAAKESGTGRALTINQLELDSLIRSKAAMYAIIETITDAVGLQPTDLHRFHVGGTFGAFIDPESAITIGMVPDLERSAFTRLGNSSLGGATRVLTEPHAISEIKAIQESITYLELNVNQDFMNRFSAAKFLPHTDPARFPTVSRPSSGD